MTASKMRGIEPHKAEGIPVITVIGNDGVRWACAVCNETVFLKDGEYSHFDKSLNLPEVDPLEYRLDDGTLCCAECSTPINQRHGWGCDSVLHGDVELDNGQPPFVTYADCTDAECCCAMSESSLNACPIHGPNAPKEAAS